MFCYISKGARFETSDFAGHKAKHLVEIVGRPALWHVLNTLSDWGVTKLILPNDLEPELAAYLGGGERWNIKILPSETKMAQEAKVLVLDLNWVGIGLAHNLWEGELADREIRRAYQEDIHGRGQFVDLWAMSGKTFNEIKEDLMKSSTCSDFLFKHEVKRVETDMIFHPIWDMEELVEANMDALSGELPLASCDVQEVSPGVFVGAGTKLSPHAKLIAPVFIGEGCFVGADTVVENSILGSGSHVGKECKVVSSILTSNTYLGPFTQLNEAYGNRNYMQKRGIRQAITITDPFLMSALDEQVKVHRFPSLSSIIEILTWHFKDRFIYPRKRLKTAESINE